MIVMRLSRPARTPSLPLVLAGLLAALLGSVAGCGAMGQGSSDDRPRVVASFYPLAYVAHRVAGPHASITNLTTPGTEPHDAELSVQHTAAVADADIALYEKGLQPSVDDAIAQSGPEHVVETTEVAPLEDGDPHFWLDPLRLDAVARSFAAQLVEVDPAHADAYRANLRTLHADLSDIDADYREGLADCALHTVVVSHDAFSYLGKYGLQFVAINGLSPGAEPSPAHLAALHDLIKQRAITTVFTETLVSPELADTLARDLGVSTDVLDPIEGLSDATRDQDYLSLMRANLAALQQANRCP
jgi:zinc transport system substrate-binding protein